MRTADDVIHAGAYVQGGGHPEVHDALGSLQCLCWIYHLESPSGVRILLTGSYWYIEATKNGLYLSNPYADSTESNNRLGSLQRLYGIYHWLALIDNATFIIGCVAEDNTYPDNSHGLFESNLRANRNENHAPIVGSLHRRRNIIAGRLEDNTPECGWWAIKFGRGVELIQLIGQVFSTELPRR